MTGSGELTDWVGYQDVMKGRRGRREFSGDPVVAQSRTLQRKNGKQDAPSHLREPNMLSGPRVAYARSPWMTTQTVRSNSYTLRAIALYLSVPPLPPANNSGWKRAQACDAIRKGEVMAGCATVVYVVVVPKVDTPVRSYTQSPREAQRRLLKKFFVDRASEAVVGE